MTQEQRALAKEIANETFARLRLNLADFSSAKRRLVAAGLTEDEAESSLAMLSESLDRAKSKGVMPDAGEFDTRFDTRFRREAQGRVIFSLHGIRTVGHWQRILSDLVTPRGWQCRLDQWTYGEFRIHKFVFPPTRERMLEWFRGQYDREINDIHLSLLPDQLPSVVAHSYGTYILGHALLRFDFIRFDKVILCGSVLPRDFPWDKLIERGQVQSVRNECGKRDIWVKIVRGYVRWTGASGALGFKRPNTRLKQGRFDYDHGTFFGRDHMGAHWVPFLEEALDAIPRGDSESIDRPPSSTPWGMYALTASALSMFGFAGYATLNWRNLGWTFLASLGATIFFFLLMNSVIFYSYSHPGESAG